MVFVKALSMTRAFDRDFDNCQDPDRRNDSGPLLSTLDDFVVNLDIVSNLA